MIKEHDDAFEIIATALSVASFQSDSFSTQFDFHSPEAKWTLRIEGNFAVSRRTDQSIPTPLLTDLLGEFVLSLHARKSDGELELRFTHDWILRVASDADYEAWEISSSEGERLVAVPGDGVARW
jgi:hypothetical protein